MGAMLKQDIKQIAIFEGFSRSEMRMIEPLIDVFPFRKEDRLFEQGQLASFLFILLSGEIVVRFKPYDGPEIDVARILPGGVFGWSAALRRSSYTSGAIAVADGEAARIRGDQLRQLCEVHPEIGVVLLERLASVIAERLRNTHAQILAMLSEGMELNSECRRRLSR